ncbi:bifunctional lysylphosphatidylglycerol synthetase/lysine--tRNA ligase LysX [Acidipropionibacterium virtanenii]|uniref:Lysine--tRNA ligase n=1 Tax=Acidipropionibacterium virtanenii TaxID=2057246 RepID=A0A344USX7_9ACTN|nr:bifunctional lysylphosphatidylglycerol synthetase/lysine--tRNA ligase LysX [Acidipropionibacterium virtanenii]AXE38375.1 Lysylphosphatidylglycerol biosynthesis bifunctional protein LysX [Acidipropionibacterium virtanenii]
MLTGAVLLIGRLLFQQTWWVSALSSSFSFLVFPIDGGGWGLAVLLLILAAGLNRRKRLSWAVCLGLFGLMWAISLLFLGVLIAEVAGGEPTRIHDDLDMAGYVFNTFSVGAILIALLVHRRRFAARTARANVRPALAVLVGGLAASVLIGWLLVWATGGQGRPRNRLWRLIGELLRGNRSRATAPSPIWVENLIGLLMAATLVVAFIMLLRSQRQVAVLKLPDELELRDLLAENPSDSLGYFALRRDKAVVFSADRRAAVCYRAVAGVALASGDPVGPRGQWPAAIEAFLAMAHAYGWSPAVLGTSEEGATAWQRAGLRVTRIGDEAVISPASFDLESRDLRPVRSVVNRLRRTGYTVRVRRHSDIAPDELSHLIALADAWRQDGEERGFSMALSRLGDPLDGDCVMVEALYPPDDAHGGEPATAGMLSLVPWSPDGLSLDVMRRDTRGAENGVTELMVAGLMGAGRELGLRRVSLNFAVFREVIEEGSRVGARPLQRLSARLISGISRWFQIEQLYRSNVKYAPDWQARYLGYSDAGELAQVGLALGLAEGQIDLPRILRPAPPPDQPIYSVADHPEITAHLERQRETRRQVAGPPARRLGEQMRLRQQTRARIIDEGGQAYPPDIHPANRPGDVATAAEGAEQSLVGRVVGVRDHGGVLFADVSDWSGQAQILLDPAVVGSGEMSRWRADISLGDHVLVAGRVGSSRNGTRSLLVRGFRLAAKALHPLPGRRSGMSDPEEKVRRRYLDLIVNPSARDQLRARSQAIRAVRETLLSHDFLEVETPILQTIHGGANARPFRTHINAYDLDLYLRIAPELYLKRLMVGGAGRVFEIGRNFRNEGADATHNPEFTMLEAYQAYGDYVQMRHLTREMILAASRRATGGTVIHGRDAAGVEHEMDLADQWRVVTVNDGISAGLGEEVTADTTTETLIGYARRLGIPVSPKWQRGDVVLELHEHLSERTTVGPTFFCDFPSDVSPLTRQHRDDPRLAEKWDLIVLGDEIATAYTELVDPVIQRERFTAQSLRAAGGDPEAMELDEDFLEALEYAMPPTGGMGMGLDRLVMLLTGASIRQTITFPLVRPRSSS